MSENKYTFNKKVVRSILEKEIQANQQLTVGVYDMTIEGEDKEIVNIYMKAPLDAVQISILSAIVSAHEYIEITTVERPALMTLVENERCLEEGIELTYRMYPVVFDIPAGNNDGNPYTFPLDFPCNVAMLGATVDLNTSMITDSMAFDVPSEVTVGYLREAVDDSTNICPCNEDAKPNIYKGMDIIIGGAVQGRITGYDENGDYLLNANFGGAFPEFTPVSVRFRVVDKYLVTTAPLTFWVSRDTDRATIVPASTPMSFHYWNDSGTAKKVQLCFELYT